LDADTQADAASDIWIILPDEKDDEIFFKCLGKRNCEKGTKILNKKTFIDCQ